MSTLSNPEYLPKDRLKTELKKHGVTFNPHENKEYYVQLYRKHVLKGKTKQHPRSEFSSDEEFVRHSPRLTKRHQVTTTSTTATTRRSKAVNVDTYLPQIQHLTDQELLDELVQFGEDIGPITATTRNVYLRKLAKLMATKTLSTTKGTPPTEEVDTGHNSYVAEWSSGEESDGEEEEEQEEAEPTHRTRSMTKKAQAAQEKASTSKYHIKETYRFQQSPAVGSIEPGLRERHPSKPKPQQKPKPSRSSKSSQASTVGSLLCSLFLLLAMFAVAFLAYEHFTCEEGKKSLVVIGWGKVREFAIKVIPEGKTVTTTTTTTSKESVPKTTPTSSKPKKKAEKKKKEEAKKPTAAPETAKA